MNFHDEYLNGYTDDKGKYHQGYAELIKKLTDSYPVGLVIEGEENQKSFIRLFSAILRTKNILTCFDDFTNDTILNNRDFQDYQSKYIDLYQDYAKKDEATKERINDDIIFEVELIKQVEVNIDYILKLVAEYHSKNCKDKEVLVSINKAIDSSIALRSKKALIEDFIEQMTVKTDVENDWHEFVEKQKNIDLDTIISEQNLKPEETKKFMTNTFRDGDIKTTGVDIDKILPAVSRFSKTDNRAEKKAKVIEKLKDFFEKYFGIV